MVNIKGLDKAEVLLELWHNSRSQGMSAFFESTTPTLEDCRRRLEADPDVDYFAGRVFKINFSGDEIMDRLYDRDNGEGACQRAVDNVRARMAAEGRS